MIAATIKRAIATLRQKLIEESIVVALVWSSSRHIRSSLVAIITLPIAIILIIPMWWMNVTSNIMSLGGIAIAIGRYRFSDHHDRERAQSA
jgi:Cu(I)/Ag(I) efflux system membrane protein CusA/SilA